MESVCWFFYLFLFGLTSAVSEHFAFFCWSFFRRLFPLSIHDIRTYTSCSNGGCCYCCVLSTNRNKKSLLLRLVYYRTFFVFSPFIHHWTSRLLATTQTSIQTFSVDEHAQTISKCVAESNKLYQAIYFLRQTKLNRIMREEAGKKAKSVCERVPFDLLFQTF